MKNKYNYLIDKAGALSLRQRRQSLRRAGDAVAVGRYNGGGNPNYVKNVYKYYNSIKPSTIANYVR